MLKKKKIIKMLQAPLGAEEEVHEPPQGQVPGVRARWPRSGKICSYLINLPS